MTETSKSDNENYLDEIEDGAGCVEIWERLSEARDESKVKADDN